MGGVTGSDSPEANRDPVVIVCIDVEMRRQTVERAPESRY
jgi:hypothetical protein